MPNGVSFRLAGGSWSHALGTSPAAVVRVFPPARILPQLHLRFRVQGHFQSMRVPLARRFHRGHVRENGVGLRSFLERLGFLNPFQAIIHPVQDVPQGTFRRNVFHTIVHLHDQRFAEFRRRQVRVAPLRLQFRVGVSARLDDGGDVPRQLRIAYFPALRRPRRKILQTANAGGAFAHAFGRRGTSPAETLLGLAGVAVTQANGDIGNEQAALVPRQGFGRRHQQSVVVVVRAVHGLLRTPSFWESLQFPNLPLFGEEQFLVNFRLPVAYCQLRG